jgi:hypothetical protein
MSAPFLEPFSHLIADFNFRRAMSLIAILSIVGTAAWTIDYYTDYSRISRLDRTVSLIERLDALDRRGTVGKDLTETRANIVKELTKLTAPPIQSPSAPNDFAAWFGRSWPKFVAGALPWFALSLFALPSVFKNEKHALTGFFGLQFFTLFFGFVATIIPSTGSRVVDFVVLPWGMLFVTGVIPMSVAAIGAYKKVRESSLQKAILNNLRMIAAASDQYFLENGVNEVALSELVGPERYIKALISVDGESYDGMVLRQGQPIVVQRRSGEQVRYEA